MNYKELYILQDKVFETLANTFGSFYITGGTALSRFYLYHRYSDDIDLFMNNDPSFTQTVNQIRGILEKTLNPSGDKLILTNSFVRVWIEYNFVSLKIEFVNDVEGRWNNTLFAGNIPVDNPANILSNKLTALVSRDEPKDVFDIVCLSENYNFNWMEVFEHTTKKAIIAEADVAMRLSSFPVSSLIDQPWHRQSLDHSLFAIKLRTIADDFLLGCENSLGAGKIPITEAQPRKFM